MDMQHNRYGLLVGRMAAEGVRSGLDAERVLGLEGSDIGDFCIGFDGFDHRVLQSMHDHIAAYFRFHYYRWPLLADLADPVEAIGPWEDFAMGELSALLGETAFARGFFEALRFANAPRGMAGEQVMQDIQRSRYARMFALSIPNSLCE
jgi:hypothetical protein